MKRFKKVYLEITNVCNLSCSFCPGTKRVPQFMKVEEFSYILEQVKPYTDYIYFHVKGEPLLHTELDRLLDLSAEKGLMANITTNGTLISSVKDKIITKPALRQINISLHSFDANEKSMDMYEYVNNILIFAKECSENTNIIVALRLWNLDQNNMTKTQMQKNRHMLNLIEQFFHLPYKIEEQVVKTRGIKLCDRVFLNQDYEFKWPGLEEEELGCIGSCYGLKDQIAILADGTVVPCCLDGEGIINLGNVFQKPFADIVDSERARNMLEGFSAKQLREELCRKCGYRSRFDK